MGKAIALTTGGMTHLTPADHKRLDLCAPEETRSNQGGFLTIVFQGEAVHCQGHR